MAGDVVQSALLAQSINEYYLSAFDHALVVVGVVFGVVGIVVPSGIAYFQARQARHELEQIKTQIDREVSARVEQERESLLTEQAAALTAFGDRSDKVIADLERKIQAELGKAKAATFHVQADVYYRAKSYVFALRSATSAGKRYVQGEDFKNLRTVVGKIAVGCLLKLDRDQECAEEFSGFENLLTRIERCDHKGALDDLVRRGRKELAAARDRESDTA